MSISITEYLSEIFVTAFNALGLPPSLAEVRFSDRPDMAQFQCNGAMPAAKTAGKNPRAVADEIISYLRTHYPEHPFTKLDIAGPGFININVHPDVIAAHAATVTTPQLAASPEDTIILDYGGPNIAKSMHVGHLRTAIIGDSVRRTLQAAGFQTLGDIHMGDWGTHMGMLMCDYIREGDVDVVMNCDLSDADAVQLLFDDMYIRYPKASAAAKEYPALMDEARAATVRLQNKEEPYYGMWQKIREISVLAMERNYAALNVHFDLWKGEADVHDLIAPMAEKIERDGFAIRSDGALVILVEKNDDKKKVPPLILYKRDGGVMYGTTDMATILERVNLYNPSRILYFVDQRQGLHFEQLFRAAKLCGLVSADTELTFAGIGTMNGTDGKPFKTRAGGVMRLADMIDMARDKAMQRLNEADLATDMTPDERRLVAEKVGLAALKFADLQNQRHADYVFDLDRMTNFEGKTGPYLLYQAVRIQSLLKKAGGQTIAPPSDLYLDNTAMRLALLLCQYPESFRLAARNYTPHVLCDYAFTVAQAFSSFYGNCHILSEADEKIRTARLYLCQQTLHILTQTLDLLGIQVPQRM